MILICEILLQKEFVISSKVDLQYRSRMWCAYFLSSPFFHWFFRHMFVGHWIMRCSGGGCYFSCWFEFEIEIFEWREELIGILKCVKLIEGCNDFSSHKKCSQYYTHFCFCFEWKCLHAFKNLMKISINKKLKSVFVRFIWSIGNRRIHR